MFPGIDWKILLRKIHEKKFYLSIKFIKFLNEDLTKMKLAQP